ncbi:hypothetical protein K438DRAFT_1817966, partial [Mycena galopus ATCC 62051]
SRNNDRMKAEPAAAPLRAKIAQFESKGGVPVPRGKFDSFGSAAPPPQQNKQRREMYGNQMKPVWVPTPRREERRTRAAAAVGGEEVADNHLPSPPESPVAGNDGGGSEPPSPASITHQQKFAVAEPEPEQEAEAEEVHPHELPEQDYVYELPTIGEQELEADEIADIPDELPEQEYVYEMPAIGRDQDSDEEPEEGKKISSKNLSHIPRCLLPPSTIRPRRANGTRPVLSTPPALSAALAFSPSTAKAGHTPRCSRPLRALLHVDTGYGTVSIQAPPRVSSSPISSPHTASRSHFEPPPRTSSSRDESFTWSHFQGQTFSSVVHARKRLPPPPSPKHINRVSNADLMALVANAAALERRLRLSVRSAAKDPVPLPVAVFADTSEKKHGGFRNPLKGARSKSRKRDKGDSDDSSHTHASADSSTWFGKLASTSRQKSRPLESAPRTLISTP